MSSSFSVYLYHTNDIHSDLDQWTRTAAFLKEREKFRQERGESVLLLDLGDHTDRVHAVTEATHGKGNVELMNEAGIRYATIGNNEGITFAKEELHHMYDEAEFQVLLANLFDTDGRRPSWAEPYTIHTTAEGVRIGLLGVTVPFYPFYDGLDWKITEPEQVIEEYLPELREQADVMILMSHLGYPKDLELASSYDFDVILGAHTHHLLEDPEWMHNTLITQCGKFGTHAGELELQFDGPTKRLSGIIGRTVDVRRLKPSPVTERLLEALEDEADKNMNEVVTEIAEPLSVSWTQESPFASLLAHGLREWCKTEISMLNSGLLLHSLPAGPVTKKDIHRLCPHPINPCVVEVQGHVLEEVVKKAFTEEMIRLPLKGFGFRGEMLGHMVFSGMEVKADYEYGEWTVRSVWIGQELLDPSETYELATLDMFTLGPLYTGLSNAASKRYYMPEMMRDILADVLVKQYTAGA
ncbi:bifunctional metallophosphatase/5'-nucleotidase [Marinococcus halophilus]|uniref:Bifunctional metallophosphatase/5'-nucleotidase n=1 Tax=Marinococcus halophilus TaxID=1371 RepID=A0A510Y800_MARHA|nr:bifunctional UDP-sugar hydrolase/5'-nucleotidase [Marinococcus halophilus]OZT79413.1 bifunctional metallophosphatase/5'-nucleotidase [Marinococcus halophilus]GEK59494.1 bifunctional metallophosphatase/5'-nucleotidase [Marinococcus halophilus]